MAHSPSKNRSVEPLPAQAEPQNTIIVPVSPIEQLAQAASVEKISHRVKTGARIAVLSSMVLMSNPSLAEKSPYEPLADASGKTQLVINEKVVKPELFAMFERNGKTEKYTKIYNKLSGADQKKVCTFYTETKGKKPEWDVLQGIYNLMKYYKEPNAFDAKEVLDLFPEEWKNYVNVNQLDADDKKIEDLKKATEKNKKATKLMKWVINAL